MQDDRPLDRRQLDEVLNQLLPFAHELLGKYGEFYPFGAAMDREGKVRMLAGELGTEHPPSDDVIALMTDGMKRERDNYNAVGICSDVRVRATADAEPTDAICVSLEHRDGMTVVVFQPYTKRDGAIEYGRLMAQPGRKTVFGA